MADSLEDDVRSQLEAVVGQLTNLSYWLGGLAAALPVSPQERLEEEDVDELVEFPARVRTAILCVLKDSLGPAIRDLRAAAAHPGKDR